MEFSGIATAALGLVASALWTVLASSLRKDKKPPEELAFQDRLASLSASLNEAAKAAAGIESELNERRALVAQLQADAQRYEALVEMNRAEVEAVAQVIGAEIQKESGRSFWKNSAVTFGVSFAFFVLGVVATLWLTS